MQCQSRKTSRALKQILGRDGRLRAPRVPSCLAISITALRVTPSNTLRSGGVLSAPSASKKKHIGGRPLGDVTILILEQNVIITLTTRFPFGSHWRDVVRGDLGLRSDDVAAAGCGACFSIQSTQRRARGLLPARLAGRDIRAGVVGGDRHAHAIIRRHHVDLYGANVRADLHVPSPQGSREPSARSPRQSPRHSFAAADRRVRPSAADARRARASGRSPVRAESHGRSENRRSASRAAGCATGRGRLRDPRVRVHRPARFGDRATLRGLDRAALFGTSGTVSRERPMDVRAPGDLSIGGFGLPSPARGRRPIGKPAPRVGESASDLRIRTQLNLGSFANFRLDSVLRFTHSGRCRRSSAGRAAHS